MSIMSFTSDNIESKLDGLALVDPPVIQSNQDSNDIRTSPTSLNNQYQCQNIAQHKPKTSLLSSSLAGERRSTISPLTSLNQTSSNPHIKAQNAFFTIDETMDKKYIPNDHPEPELLASSVGKDLDGRLIPSSSTISLLSLNHNNNKNNNNNNNNSNDNYSNNNSNNYLTTSPNPNSNLNQYNIQSYLPSPRSNIQLNQPQPQSQTQPQNQINTSFIDRKNSYHNITSRNSITHLNHIRLQPYQKFTSPSPTLPQAQQQQDYVTFHTNSNATSQSIPIDNKNGTSLMVPDSPCLDPTSLGGSPSRFWLSSQTPPRSLANSFNRNSRTQLYQMQNQYQLQQQQQQQQQAQQQQQQQYFHQSFNNQSNVPVSTVKAININIANNGHAGDHSPILNPVQTPSEDPPMTPLYLDSNRINNVQQTGYFDSISIDRNDTEQIIENNSDNDDDLNDDDNDDENNKVINETNHVEKSRDIIMN